jgi:serine protease Do
MRVPSAGRLIRRTHGQPHPAVRWTGLSALMLIVASFGAHAPAAELSGSVQQRIRAATFEVVQLKPTEDPLTYERPLPLELIPYQQRVDKYRSIGTAFAIGNNRFVTAGHVIAVGIGSQFGPPAVRDAAGQVYDIDKVLKYSERQDFIEFSLQRVPKDVRPLETGKPPALNSTVFAVGNALGEGIVIRDGVYTSDTPEEEEGAWKWLRFTAAASPGNSGGPLIDERGRVIGVVLRKSPSENLNYAAPIQLVTDASETEGSVDERANFRVPFIDAAELMKTHEKIPLPTSFADLSKVMASIHDSVVERGDAQILEHHADRLFPASATSAELLTRVYRAPFPRQIEERRDDRMWVAAEPTTRKAQLDHNGFVQSGNGMFRLRAPDDVPLATLWGDSKLFMDMMLRSGFPLQRNVGTDQVKVTSLGKAQEEFPYRDKYGRLWQVKTWPIAYADTYVISFNLPTPEGYVSLITTVPSGLKDLVVRQVRLLTDYIWVTFEGTLERWREYLADKAVQPSAFSGFSLDITPDYSHVRFLSKREQLEIGPREEPLTHDSVLSLNFSFFKDSDAVVWDVGGISLGEGGQKNNWLIVRRETRPAPSLPEELQNNWSKLTSGQFPYNGVAADETGGMAINMPADLPKTNGQASAADQVNVRYVLRVLAEGAPGQDAMHAKLEGLHKAFKAFEH